MALYEPLFKALTACQTRYVVVGGVATVLHGYARLTADIDLIIDLEPQAATRAMRALGALGLIPRIPESAEGFADPQTRAGWIRDTGMQVFSLYSPQEPLLSVDLFVNHPIDFDDLLARSQTCEISDCTVQIASIPDLIDLKRLANRQRDREDIEKLEEILRLRERDDETPD